ncbi:hypothetical protein [Shewanella ulleungensis]|uniref:hypothetical protein n=1 Tax=Shewanella ulleungensis TaxID=2282699 RepID=UPI003D7A9121
MALHGEQGQFTSVAPGQGLGNATMLDSLTAFQPIVLGYSLRAPTSWRFANTRPRGNQRLFPLGSNSTMLVYYFEI